MRTTKAWKRKQSLRGQRCVPMFATHICVGWEHSTGYHRSYTNREWSSGGPLKTYAM